MKNLTKIFMAVCVALFAFACATDPTEDRGVNVGVNGQTTLTISLEEVRTHINGEVGGQYPLYWSVGDKIAVNGVASEPLSEEYHGSTSATFTVGNLAYPCNIVYPAPAEGVTAAEGLQAVTFLATQEYAAGTFAEGAAPLYAQVAQEGDGINLQHLSGVLRVAPKGDGEVLTSMTVTAESGKIAGNFDVDCATGVLTAHEDAVNTITVTFGEGLTLGAEATPIYVAVPAGEYGVFALRLNTATDSMLIRFDSEGEKAVKAGVVREFAEFTYVPKVEENGIFEIYDEASLRRFAANADKFYPYTSAKVVATIDMTGKEWTSIEGFEHSFDGGSDKGFKIKGLTAPLFGTTTATEIKNVHLVGVNIEDSKGTRKLGAVACVVDNTSAVIQNCSAEGTMTLSGERGGTTEEVASYSYIAGVIGQTTTTQKVTGLVNKVNISVGGTFADYPGGRPYVSGCVVDTNGELENCTNLGTIEIREDLVCQTSLYIGGVVWNAKEITSCVNGSANSGESQKLGAITINGSVGRTCFMGGVTSNNTGQIVVSGCRNYAPLKLYAETTTSGTGYVYAAGVVAAYNFVTTITNCENYGDIDCKFTAIDVSYIGGVTAGNSSTYFTGISDCSNHGNITIDGTDINTTLMVGGVINIMESKATYTNLTNTGDISINNFASKKDGYIIAGGIAGRIKKNVNGTTLTGNMVNEGDITLSGTLNRTDGKTIRVGGFVGLLETLPTISVTFTNSGDITFDGTSNSDIKLGGIIGACAKVVTLNNSTQTGDVTCTGTVASGKKAYVGGIVGGDDASIRGYVSGVRCFCNVKAPGYTNVGMISGLAYDSANPFSNCHIGGTIQRGDATTATPLALSNYTTLAYSDTPEKESFVNVDKCGWLENENADPQWDYAPGITISNADELKAFANQVADKPTLANIVGLTADIDMTGEEWTPIEGFAGVFDGKDYEIKGLTAPLFGTTTATEIKNVHLVGVNIEDSKDTRKIGAVACFVDNASATIQNCSAQGRMALSGVRGGTTANEASYSYIAGVIGKTTTTQKISGLVNKVNITVSATFNDANSRPYIAGCVAQTAGELENCTNLGTIETTADFVTKASLYVGGVTWYAAHLTSCVNGSANSGEIQVLGAITIKGAVSRISYIGGVTSNNTGTTMEIHGCKNYGKLNVEVDNISTGSGHYVAAACIAASYNNVKALVECENYGNLNCKFKTKNTAGASYIGGIAAGNTQDALRSVLDCSNHGDITIDGSGVQTTVMVGGIMNIFETPSTHHNLTNTGDISINNYASKKDGYIIAGGITGRINDAGAKLTGSIVNTGAITLSGTLNHANGKTIHVGGIAGRMNALPAEASATFANSGAITFDGTSNSNINLGGIFGSCDTNITLNAKNTGNITCTGTVADGKEAYVGGIVGGYDTTRGALSGARCFCTLKAIGYENVGMVTGLAYDPAAEPFTNCHIGGKIATTIDSVANTPNWTPLDDWSFIDFIYGEPISTEQATAGKLGWLERNVDDTPIGADGTPIVEQ